VCIFVLYYNCRNFSIIVVLLEYCVDLIMVITIMINISIAFEIGV